MLALVSVTKGAQIDSVGLDYDPAYIMDYSDRLTIKHLAMMKSVNLTHYDKASDSQLKYKPNENLNVGLGIATDWLSFNAVFNLPAVNHDNEQFGRTESFDLQTNIYLRKWAIDLAILHYEGFHLSNTSSILPNFPSDEYLVRPDITSTTWSATGLYIFNDKKFSYRAAFTQVERQIKSSGSWVIGSYVSVFNMNADSTLIPGALSSSADFSQDFRKVTFYNFGAMGGYAYTLVLLKRFYLSGTLTLGAGPQYEHGKETEHRKDYTNWRRDGFLGLRGAAGYNGENFFTCVTIFGTSSGSNDQLDAYLQRGYNTLRFIVGYRFDKPKFLQKPAKLNRLF